MALPGLILDLDDTLFDSAGAYERALRKVDIDPKSSRYLNARKRAKERLGSSHVSSHNRILYFKEMLEAERAFSPRRLLDLHRRYEAALEADIVGQWRDLKRAELFQELNRRFAILLLTNEITRTQITKLSFIDPDGKLFARILTSEEMGREKPETALFLEGARRLERKLSQCVVVGNDLNVDILPAVREGAKGFLTVEFTEEKDPRCPAGVKLISHLEALREI